MSTAVQQSDAPPTGKNLPEVVNNIVWARQLEAKVSAPLDFYATPILVAYLGN